MTSVAEVAYGCGSFGPVLVPKQVWPDSVIISLYAKGMPVRVLLQLGPQPGQLGRAQSALRTALCSLILHRYQVSAAGRSGIWVFAEVTSGSSAHFSSILRSGFLSAVSIIRR
jgi:hypothetical protein